MNVILENGKPTLTNKPYWLIPRKKFLAKVVKVQLASPKGEVKKPKGDS